MGMRDKSKKRTTKLELGFNSPPRTDTDPIKMDVMRSMNVVLSPDGTEAMPREGHVLYRKYNVTSSPTGRKVIVIDRKPPGVNLTANMIVSSARRTIDSLVYTKEPTLVNSDEEDVILGGTCLMTMTPPTIGSIAPIAGEVVSPSFDVTFDIARTGDLSSSATAEIVMLYNTAGGTPTLSPVGTFTWGAGDSYPEETSSGEFEPTITFTGWVVPNVLANYSIAFELVATSSNGIADPAFSIVTISFSTYEI